MANNIILSGIVGSQAYGLATDKSDTDRIGIFAVETQALHVVRKPDETYTSRNNDTVYHEAAKWCRLAYSGNPTIIELVWLPTHLIETCNHLGHELIEIRSAFISASQIRRSYLGYASGQLRQLERLHGDFSHTARESANKYARNLLRMCWQGYALYKTGILPIAVDNPERFHAFGQKVADGHINDARKALSNYEDLFKFTPSVLPSSANEELVDRWMRFVRIWYLRSK